MGNTYCCDLSPIDIDNESVPDFESMITVDSKPISYKDLSER